MKYLTLFLTLFWIGFSCSGSGSSDPVALEFINLNARFGFDHMTDSLYAKADDLGAKWDRPHIGPAIWGQIETSEGEYDWSDMDSTVQLSQASGMNLLFSVFPYADWDQSTCHDPLDSSETSQFETLGDYRQQPCDMDKWVAFLALMVERYDGDGVDDMENLLYPVRFWEIANEPAVSISGDAGVSFYTGTASEYKTLLERSYNAIKTADTNAQVLHAGIFALMNTATTFWGEVFDLGGAEFMDIANYHSITDHSIDAQMSLMLSFMESHSLTHDVWVTELEFSEDAWGEQTASSATNIVIKTYIQNFSGGSSKIFMAGPNYDLSSGNPNKDTSNPFALLDTEGNGTALYTAMKVMIDHIDEFSSVTEVQEGTYTFVVNDEEIYVNWATSLPSGITGTQTITDLAGNVTNGTVDDIPLDGSISFVRKGD